MTINARSAPTREELAEVATAMRFGYEQLFAFARQPSFRTLVDDMYSLPPNQRPAFVRDVVMREDSRRERGIQERTGVLILRSAFGDRRPTLFCIKWYLPHHLHRYWQNVNITFDNLVDADSIPSDEGAWRLPLEAEVQSRLIAASPE